MIGVVDDDDDDDDGNDDVIITPLQQQQQTANVDYMYYDWTREEDEVVYPACCFDSIKT